MLVGKLTVKSTESMEAQRRDLVHAVCCFGLGESHSLRLHDGEWLSVHARHLNVSWWPLEGMKEFYFSKIYCLVSTARKCANHPVCWQECGTFPFYFSKVSENINPFSAFWAHISRCSGGGRVRKGALNLDLGGVACTPHKGDLRKLPFSTAMVGNP